VHRMACQYEAMLALLLVNLRPEAGVSKKFLLNA
jgi:hypothetical protein